MRHGLVGTGSGLGGGAAETVAVAAVAAVVAEGHGHGVLGGGGRAGGLGMLGKLESDFDEVSTVAWIPGLHAAEGGEDAIEEGEGDYGRGGRDFA